MENIHYKNINRLTFVQLNINSLRNKFDSLQTVNSDDREVAETFDTFSCEYSSCLKILPKENYEKEIGNGNKPVLNYINKFRNHPSIKHIKSKKKKKKNKLLLSIIFLMKKFLTKSRTTNRKNNTTKSYSDK